MAFPTTSILDNFNRADQGPPPSANWTGAYGTGLKVISNSCAPAAAAETSGVLWNVSTFGPDTEVFITISTVVADAGRLYMRVDGAGNNGYDLVWNDLSSTIIVNEVDNLGAENQLGATISQAIASGDSIGFSAIGSTLTVWYKSSGGSWTSLGTRTDSAHNSAGSIGMDLYSDSGLVRADDFGGGTVVAAAAGTSHLTTKSKFWGA